jgi:hypothetical protein
MTLPVFTSRAIFLRIFSGSCPVGNIRVLTTFFPDMITILVEQEPMSIPVEIIFI